VVKHVDAVELRVVVASALAVAADAVHVHDLARRSSLEAGSTQQRRATRAGQRAARREVQKHKPAPSNDPRKARSSSAFNFCVDKGLGEKKG
jgi:hypothetical protein